MIKNRVGGAAGTLRKFEFLRGSDQDFKALGHAISYSGLELHMTASQLHASETIIQLTMREEQYDWYTKIVNDSLV